MSDSNPVVSDTVLCQLQIALNLSRTPYLGYKTFLLDTSIRIQTFNYDCNYLVSIAILTSILEGNTAVYNLNLSRTPCLGYKTFLLDTSIRIQTFNYDCNYLVLIAISTSIMQGNIAVYNNFLDYYICKIISIIFVISNVAEIFHLKQNLTRKCIEMVPTFKYAILILQ